MANTARICVGRRQLIRSGRFLMNAGMLRGANDPATNGEFLYLSEVLNSCKAMGIDPVVIDIGANLGIYTSHAANLLDGRGRVFAAEPCHETMVQLKQNTENLPTHVDYLNVAFSDKEGEGELFVIGAGNGTNSLEGGVTSTQNTEKVELLTLDCFLERESIDEVDFVKIDTEGHDYSVIKGAERTLKSGRIKALQFEYNWRWIGQRSFLKDVFAFIEEMNYRIGRVTPEGIEVYDSWNQSMETLVEDNYAIYRADTAEHLKLILPPST